MHTYRHNRKTHWGCFLCLVKARVKVRAKSNQQRSSGLSFLTKTKMALLTLSTMLIANVATADLTATQNIDLGELTSCSTQQGNITLQNNSASDTITVTPSELESQLNLQFNEQPFTLAPNQSKDFWFSYRPRVDWYDPGITVLDSISFQVQGQPHGSASTSIFARLNQPVVCAFHLEMGNHPGTHYPYGLAGRAYAWGDVDNDGDLDLAAYLIEDGSVSTDHISWSSAQSPDGPYGVPPNFRGQLVFLENRNGSLQEPRLITNSIAGGYNSLQEIEFLDLDGDNQLELVYRTFVPTPVGRPELAQHRTFYVPFNGAAPQNNAGLPVVQLALPRSEYDIVWADFDQDGDIDAGIYESIHGEESYNLWVQAQPFEFVKGQDLAMLGEREPGAYDSTVIDVDSDGDLDILLSSPFNKGSNYQRHLLRNTSESNPSIDNLFVKEDNFLVTGPYLTRHAFAADFNNDGQAEIASDGIVHRLDSGNGAFYTLYGEQYSNNSQVAWADFDNDGQWDAMHGSRNASPTLTLFPKNAGQAFTHIPFSFALFNAKIRSNGEGNMNGATADYDRDGRMEIVTTNYSNDGDILEVVARGNTRPEPPTDEPRVTVFDGSQPVVLAWGAGSDRQTPTASLTYNVYVRAVDNNGQPAETFIVSPQANLDTGIGLVDVDGNAGYATEYTLRNLPAGDYEWGVQTVDTGWARSEFTNMGFFSVTVGQCEPELKITGITEDDRLDDVSDPSSPDSNERAREYFVQYFVVNESHDCDSGPIDVLATTANYSKLRASFGMGADVRAVAQPEFDQNSGSISVQALPARKSFVVTLQYYDYQWGNAVHHDYDIVEPVLTDESKSHFEIDLPALDDPNQNRSGDARLNGLTIARYRPRGNYVYGYALNYFMVTNEGEEELTNVMVDTDQEGLTPQYKFKFGTRSNLSSDGSTWTIPSLKLGQRSYAVMYTIERGANNSKQPQARSSSAEIVSMDQTDLDSMPGNGKTASIQGQEDDAVQHLWQFGRTTYLRNWH